MAKSEIQNIESKDSCNFNQTDWSSAYCNVEKEFNQIKLNLIEGEVPKELSGTLYRNGPGKLERNGEWVHHPFDGDGMITSMRFKDSEVTLSNRFVRTKAWEEEEAAGKFLYRGVFGTKKSGLKIFNAGEKTGDKVWNMPIDDDYNSLLDTDIADMKNIGGPGAGSITAACFLKRHVNNTPWAHLDIAGVTWKNKSDSLNPRGASGWGVKLLFDLIKNFDYKI